MLSCCISIQPFTAAQNVRVPGRHLNHTRFFPLPPPPPPPIKDVRAPVTPWARAPCASPRRRRMRRKNKQQGEESGAQCWSAAHHWTGLERSGAAWRLLLPTETRRWVQQVSYRGSGRHEGRNPASGAEGERWEGGEREREREKDDVAAVVCSSSFSCLKMADRPLGAEQQVLCQRSSSFNRSSFHSHQFRLTAVAGAPPGLSGLHF